LPRERNSERSQRAQENGGIAAVLLDVSHRAELEGGSGKSNRKRLQLAQIADNQEIPARV
jgi:hypothetical protein